MLIYQGKIFALNEHLARLQSNLKALDINLSLSPQQWKDLLQRLLLKNALTAQDGLYLKVTRGNPGSRQHFYENHTIEPTVFAYIFPVKPQPIKSGIKAVTVADERWQNCHIKTINLLPNVLAKQKAHAHDAEESIFIDQGYAMEGHASNLFIVQNNTIITPPKNPKILPGVTRDFVIRVIEGNQFSFIERHVTLDELYHADEVWLTSSNREIMPVLQIDDKIISDGKIGHCWQQINQLFQTNKLNNLNLE
jgi:D-alanine transaminase